MKIAILSCFYPYRGGIAQFNANIYNELGKTHEVRAFNFKRQYPGILFPGKTQYVTAEDNAIKIDSTPILDSINPLSYISTSRAIREWEPDLLIMRYWISFFAPSHGFVGRHQLKKTKVISILDNVVPHEKRPFDTALTKYFLSSGDGFVVLSSSVGEDLIRLKPDARFKVIPHPLYNHFGEKQERDSSIERLSLEKNKKNILFFGLIRDYKGLDILIDAFSLLDQSYQLIIAGEPYGSFEPYARQLALSPAKERIKLFNRYIPDGEVPLFFSCADVVVLPYRSATQSGISAISYHFGVPIITTDVGGLKEIIEKQGTGIVVEYPECGAIAKGIREFFEGGNRDTYIEGVERAKRELSWQSFAQELLSFYNTL
ncbi:MAG: glycosyltransferase [Bacteroidales bacterium]|nr:glycosyltransferase [Bacteroidales bacterium]